MSINLSIMSQLCLLLSINRITFHLFVLDCFFCFLTSTSMGRCQRHCWVTMISRLATLAPSTHCVVLTIVTDSSACSVCGQPHSLWEVATVCMVVTLTLWKHTRQQTSECGESAKQNESSMSVGWLPGWGREWRLSRQTTYSGRGSAGRCCHWQASKACRYRGEHTFHSALLRCGASTHTCQTPVVRKREPK